MPNLYMFTEYAQNFKLTVYQLRAITHSADAMNEKKSQSHPISHLRAITHSADAMNEKQSQSHPITT